MPQLEPQVESGVSDSRRQVPVVDSVQRFTGAVISVDSDTILINSMSVVRDVVRHPGAVAVVAVRCLQSEWQILMVRQYRHPVSMDCVELPAGLRDVSGEESLLCAQRELLEETGYVADSWQPLLAGATSPGGSDEVIELWWAEGLTWQGHSGSGEAEELSMTAMWVPLAVALEAVFNGLITNVTAQVGIFAAARKIQGM